MSEPRPYAPPVLRWLSLLGLCACSEAPPVRPNLILVSLDTLRADRLSCYGYERPTSPRLDALAAEGALFENAIAESPWTLPSHATMLTGLYPRAHGATLPSRSLDPATVTLAQRLSNLGYATLGLTEGGYVGRYYGFERGFDVYSENRPDLATSLGDAHDLLGQLATDQPFFLFLHTFEIHCPYEPPEEDVELFRTEGEGPLQMRGACGKEFNASTLTPEQVRTVSNRYDAGIHATDSLLGTFFEELEARGRLENTYVVITSDHGEQLYEHGRIGHERSVHRENLIVPWIVRGPGIAPLRIAAPVGLVDVTPTLLELVGAPVPDGLQGHSRAGWLLGEETASDAPPRVSELDWRAELASAMTATHQLLVDRQSGQTNLLEFTEAGERSLDPEDPAGEPLLRALATHAEMTRVDAPATEGSPDRETLERLRALGYD